MADDADLMMADDADLYLKPRRSLSRWWLLLGVAGLLLLTAGGLVLVMGTKHFLHKPAAQTAPTMTLVPTFTPHPTATETPPALTLSVRPWTDDQTPVGLVEVILSLPPSAQTRTVSHDLPPGFRYWRGDLLQTRQNLWSTASFAMGWSGLGPAEVRWYLLREPGAILPATLAVTVDGQTLTVILQPATPAMISVKEENR